jgi:cytochrome c biogenesis protein CcmG, thiol:disulfide interchange protein DsbE
MNSNNPLSPSLAPAKRRGLPLWIMVLAFALMIGFLLLLAFALRRTQQGTIQIGQTVPGFTLQSFDGQIIHTADLAGKVVVINFWASWCKPCEQEAAELEQAWKTYEPGGEVVFLGVDYVDTEPQALAYIEKFAITYPNGPDLRTSISQLFRIKGVPETYFIGRDGKLAHAQIGPFNSLAEITAIVDGLLK